MTASGRRGALAFIAFASLSMLAAIPCDVLPWLRGPAPYPPEWQWDLRTAPLALGLRLLPAAFCIAGLLGMLVVSERPWLERSGPRLAFLLAAVALGFLLQLGLLHIEPAGARRTLLARVMSRTSTSYYTVAVSPVADDPREFLRRHAGLLAGFRREAKHAATHPPGPVLYYRAALAVCRTWPEAASWLLPADGLGRGALADPPVRAAALLGGLGLCLACALTTLPIAALARGLGASRSGAAHAGVLWNLLPGPLLMVPHFDGALALPVTLTSAALMAALRAPSAGSAIRRSLLAGLIGGLGLYMSYGTGAFLLLGALAVSAAQWQRGKLERWLTVVAAALAGAVMVFVSVISLGHESLQAARTALAIHAELYTAPRSYWLWLGFDPLDLAVFVGLPIALLCLVRLAVSLAAWRQRCEPIDRFRLAFAGGLFALVMSGLVRGEVGRIWIPLMPMVVVSALVERDAAERLTVRESLLVGILTAALTLAIDASWAVA